MVDDAVWKRRFHVFALIRLAGLAMIFLGVAIAYAGLLRAGGWPTVGAIVAILGVVDAVFAPRILKKQWEREDAQ
jgi:membrane protein implicated in regulation of membrane protease activity